MLSIAWVVFLAKYWEVIINISTITTGDNLHQRLLLNRVYLIISNRLKLLKIYKVRSRNVDSGGGSGRLAIGKCKMRRQMVLNT